MKHRKRTMNPMSRRAAVAMVASLGLTLKFSQYDDRRAEWQVWSGQRRAGG